MSSPLIKITTTPIKIAVNVEKGHYEEVEQKQAVQREISRQQRVQALEAQQQVKTSTSTYKPTATQAQRVDSYQGSQSVSTQIPVEFATIDNVLTMRFAQSASQVSVDSTQPATAVKQNYVTSPSSNSVGYVPNTSDDIKWEPTTLDFNFEFNFENEGPDMRYVPGQVTFEIEQYPTVKIEYLGGPQYVPPSADPNYKGDK